MDPNATLDDWRDASADALRAAKLLASWLRRGGFEPSWTTTERADFERYCATHGIQLPTTFGGGDGE